MGGDYVLVIYSKHTEETEEAEREREVEEGWVGERKSSVVMGLSLIHI